MKIYKNEVSNYLNKFLWDYKEIFFEKSKSFNFVCVNGIFKTPSFSSLEWFSLLSREEKKEYFKHFSSFENIEEKISLFGEEFWIKNIYNSQKIDSNQQFLELWEINFDELNLENIISYVKEAYESEIKNNKEIKSSEISLIFSKKSFIVASNKQKFEKDELFYNTLFIKLVWEKNQQFEETYKKITWIDIIKDFSKENILNLVKGWIENLKIQLSWQNPPQWIMDVIIWNEAWWTIIHEAVWHWLEADLLNGSIYKWKLWQKVANEKVSLVDNPTILKNRWFYQYDHEWEKSQNTILIQNWVLKWYLHNQKTAQKFETSSTWHGRRESYKHKTLVRMWITYLLPWNDKKEDLIKSVKNWIYVSQIAWWQVNTTSWDFVFKIQNWYLIENWKITNSIKWATLSWNWPKMLNEIYWICDDLIFFDAWTCWKWQSMPVWDATPTILTRLKVS